MFLLRAAVVGLSAFAARTSIPSLTGADAAFDLRMGGLLFSDKMTRAG
jgi:hypothetical protein